MKSETGQTQVAGTKILRVVTSLTLGLLIAGCELNLQDFIPQRGNPPTGTEVLIFTATSTPSASATQPTPTFTSTPTLIGEKTKTPTSSVTPSNIPDTPPAPVTPLTATPTTYLDGLVSVRLSANNFYVKGCDPDSIKLDVQVLDAGHVTYVVLFVRLKSSTSGANGQWTNFTMENLGTGAYTHELKSEEIIGLDQFVDPLVQFQFVTTDSLSRVIGRTGIFNNYLSLNTSSSCTATPSGTLTPLSPAVQ